MRTTLAAAALLLSVFSARQASAQLLTFDDLISAPSYFGEVYAPSPYMGYNFGGKFTTLGWCGDASQCDWTANLGNYLNTFPTPVSGSVLMFGNVSTLMSFGRATPFTFTSAYLGAAFGVCGRPNVVPTMNISAYLGGNLVYSTNRALACSGFSKQTFDWTNVDRVDFLSNDTVNPIFDDLLVADIVVTPEPVSVALVGAGLLAIGGAARRRRRTQ